MLLAATSIPINWPPSAISCLIPGVGGRGRSPYNKYLQVGGEEDRYTATEGGRAREERDAFFR